jgi:nitrite reductase/ring-hydroxylating ferredoxin subunit
MSNQSGNSIAVARVGELAPGQTKKFLLQVDGREEECFVVNHQGELYAYVNRCCHVPMTMDWVDNQFMTEDKEFIQCATHGACYQPETGECVSGPPFGEFLIRVPIVIEGDEVRAFPPPSNSHAGDGDRSD